ncbi:hypothetical protein DFH09DRAFT_1075590 [Mycena vulgaris]|nr:hypothetical protein DFH09DRAFT_1075590 [Mycena vulgaris]
MTHLEAAFANELHISSSNSAVTFAMLNGALCKHIGGYLTELNKARQFGRLLIGYLSDKMNLWILAFSTLIKASATIFVLWGVLSHTFAGLLAFGVAYGTVAGG